MLLWFACTRNVRGPNVIGFVRAEYTVIDAASLWVVWAADARLPGVANVAYEQQVWRTVKQAHIRL